MMNVRHMRWAVALVASFALQASGDAFAGEETRANTSTPFAQRALSIDAQIGSGTPLGIAGIAVQYTPISMLMLQVGVGATANGVRGGLAIGPRFVIGTHFALDVSLGYAVGDHRAGDNITNFGGLTRSLKVSDPDPVGTTHMFSATMEARYRSSGGVQTGVLFGVSSIMNRADFSGEEVRRWAPFVGATVGYAFAL